MGERILILTFKNELSVPLNQKIQQLAKVIEQKGIPGIRQLITAMNTLSIVYDPLKTSEQQLQEKIDHLDTPFIGNNSVRQRIIHIPVTFDDNYAPDLPYISEHAGLTTEETIDLFISKTYFVYMTGFIAGIPYMGNIDRLLSLPRRSSPRLSVTKGSVAIANQMTDIYTVQSPGGWHLIGWTPLEVFNVERNPPGYLKAGMYVKYERITADNAEKWSAAKQKEWDDRWHTLNV